LAGGTGSAFAVIPSENATGNWIKGVQRVPGRIALDPEELQVHPLRRLAMITSTTTYLKRRLRSGGGNVFDVLRLPTPLARAAVRWMRHIAARGINLFITNVPGPTEPLFLAGARLLSAVPVAPLTANVPLGIAALSYAGTLQIGVNADASVTDLAVLRDAMATEFATLATSARSGAGLPRIETGAHQASVGAAPKSGGAGMAGKKWADLSHRQRAAVLVLGSAQLLLAGSAWSDLAHRPAGQVNGRKGVWAAVIAVNWLGPLAYFRWGRRG